MSGRNKKDVIVHKNDSLVYIVVVLSLYIFD